MGADAVDAEGVQGGASRDGPPYAGERGCVDALDGAQGLAVRERALEVAVLGCVDARHVLKPGASFEGRLEAVASGDLREEVLRHVGEGRQRLAPLEHDVDVGRACLPQRRGERFKGGASRERVIEVAAVEGDCGDGRQRCAPLERAVAGGDRGARGYVFHPPCRVGDAPVLDEAVERGERGGHRRVSVDGKCLDALDAPRDGRQVGFLVVDVVFERGEERCHRPPQVGA